MQFEGEPARRVFSEVFIRLGQLSWFVSGRHLNVLTQVSAAGMNVAADLRFERFEEHVAKLQVWTIPWGFILRMAWRSYIIFHG